MGTRDRVLSLIGIAAKAGKLNSGGFAAEKAVKGGKAFLVLIARDASENTQKRFGDMCAYYQVPLKIYGTKETLGHAIGKQLRAEVVLLDQGFAQSVLKLIDEL